MWSLKKKHSSDRAGNDTPALFTPVRADRASISELDLLTIGTVNDMYAEMSNDDFNYPALATQEQMDRILTGRRSSHG